MKVTHIGINVVQGFFHAYTEDGQIVGFVRDSMISPREDVQEAVNAIEEYDYYPWIRTDPEDDGYQEEIADSDYLKLTVEEFFKEEK